MFKSKKDEKKDKIKPVLNERSTFQWISIRNLKEKDKNKFRKSKLININVDNISDKKEALCEDEDFLERFITHFHYEKYFQRPQENKTFTLNITKATEDKKQKINKNKKNTFHALKTTNEIIYQNHDLSLFALDGYKLKSLDFHYDINNFLYLFYWGIEILKGLKNREKINSLIILDATISLNRFLKEQKLKNEFYLSGFIFISERLNRRIRSIF